jgi:hypothetical protein
MTQILSFSTVSGGFAVNRSCFGAWAMGLIQGLAQARRAILFPMGSHFLTVLYQGNE